MEKGACPLFPHELQVQVDEPRVAHPRALAAAVALPVAAHLDGEGHRQRTPRQALQLSCAYAVITVAIEPEPQPLMRGILRRDEPVTVRVERSERLEASHRAAIAHAGE